ncbi:hypothetical protein PG991_014467 [Apiospora marii]|uniref:Uncharacterized protein n=1 Tax=Apiospora marii TaxID=335849 RepID=A0ABR1R3M1_9PEZI
MHRTRTFLATIRDKDPRWLRDHVLFRFKPLTEEELENKTKQERAQIIVPRLDALNPLPLVGYLADSFHPEINPFELDYSLLTGWLEKYPGPPPDGYVFPFDGRLTGYMLRDLYKRGFPDDDEEMIARQKDVEKLVSDKDGYSTGSWFKPPLPENSKERLLDLATRQEILRTYQWACSLWEEHPQHKALKESFEALSANLGSTTINKLVCIGLGSLSPPPYHTLEELREAHEEAKKMKKEVYFGYYYLRPYFQHLAAQTVAQLLKHQNDGKPLDLYVQDIGYREDDI